MISITVIRANMTTFKSNALMPLWPNNWLGCKLLLSHTHTHTFSCVVPCSLCSSLHIKCCWLIHRNPWVHKRRATSDDVSSLLCHHDGRSVQVAADNAGHDWGVDHTQPLHTQDVCARVDHRHRVRWWAHLAGAGWMVGAVSFATDKSVNFSIGLDLRTGLYFWTTESVEGLLGENLSGEFDRLPELPHVNIWQERRWKLEKFRMKFEKSFEFY